MLKVLIVDDEAVVRRGIVLGVDWASMGCVVVGEASNGEEGIAAAQQLEGRAAVGVVVARVLDAEEEEESEEEARKGRGAVREGEAEGRGLGDGLDHVQLGEQHALRVLEDGPDHDLHAGAEQRL